MLAVCLSLASDTAALGQTRDSQPSPGVLPGTHPLHRSIEILKDQLEKMEAKHDTLEAATEQFRLKAKSIKDELDDEKSRYEELLLAKTSLEVGHEDESASWKSKLALAEFDKGEQKEKLEFLEKENSKLRFSLGERDREMSAIRSENSQLRQELSRMKALKKNDSPTIWQDVTESELGSTLVELAEEYLDWIKDNGSYLIEKLSASFSVTQLHSIMLFRRAEEQLQETFDQLQRGSTFLSDYIRETMVGFSHDSPRGIFTALLQGFTAECDRLYPIASNFWQESTLPLFSDWLANSHFALPSVLSRLVVIQKAIAASLEWVAVAIACYHITNLEGSRSHWLYRMCMSVKTHSGIIIVLFDIAIGLLLLEIAFIAFRKLRDGMACVRRKPTSTFGKQVLVSPKGVTPTTSLLRTAGGLSLRSNNSVSDSMSG
jgi:hypothetical protein